MRITPQQWTRAQAIVNQLSQDEKTAFSSIRPREIRLLLSSERELKPQQKDRINSTRKMVERLFLNHSIQDELSRALLIRLLVLGESQIFDQLQGVKDPVEICDAFEVMPDESDDGQDNGDASIPPPSNSGVIRVSDFDTVGLMKVLEPRWDRERLLGIVKKYKPFSERLGLVQQELLEESPHQWKWSRSADDRGASARANRKDLPFLCEDYSFVFHVNGIPGRDFWVGGALDGVSLGPKKLFSDNICKWLFMQLISFHVSHVLRALLSKSRHFPDYEEIQDVTEGAVVFAQINMQNLLHEIRECLTFAGKKETGVDTLVDSFLESLEKAPPSALDELRQNYLIRFAGATTLELVVVSPSHRQGLQLKIGDGQTLLVRSDGHTQSIGPNNKKTNHSTSAIGVHDSQKDVVGSFTVTPFQVAAGDVVLVTTDGLGDNLPSVFPAQGFSLLSSLKNRLGFLKDPTDINGLAEVLKKQQGASDTVYEMCERIDGSSLEKPDDLGFVVLKV